QGSGRGDPQDRAGDGHPDPRLPEAQRELCRPPQQAARGPDGRAPRATLEGRSIPFPRPGKPAGEALLPEAPPHPGGGSRVRPLHRARGLARRGIPRPDGQGHRRPPESGELSDPRLHSPPPGSGKPRSMTNGTRRPISLDAPPEQGSDEPRRVPPDKAWSGGAAREIAFRDDGVVTTARVSPIVESLKNTYSSVGESLRLLGATGLTLRQERGMKCLAVTSALPGDGKTTVSFGLGVALARDQAQRILLIEADVRRPSLSATLGLPPSPALSERLHA